MKETESIDVWDDNMGWDDVNTDSEELWFEDDFDTYSCGCCKCCGCMCWMNDEDQELLKQ